MALNSCEGERPLVTAPDEKTYYAHRSEGEFYQISLSRERTPGPPDRGRSDGPGPGVPR